METLLFWTLYTLLGVGDTAADPIHSAFIERKNARAFECERLSQAEAHERYPGRVPETNARAQTLMQIDALVCKRRILSDDKREPRDALILDELSKNIGELTQLATAYAPNKRWYVDAFYPDKRMTQKIANATRTAMVSRKQKVSDIAPLLTAGDILVLRSFDMKDAIALACQRFYDEGTLGKDDAFLALALLHANESQLHAGVCTQEGFRWLR